MARIRPFRALRYDVPDLAAVVAPPYDVISDEQRTEYLGRSPYNVVHLTLPDSEEQAARDLAAWQEEGILVRDPEPSYWWLTQDYVGPDGVARQREGFVASLRAEPYENRVILPHERTHAGPKEGRLKLLRATRTQLEPILLLYDEEVPIPAPECAPDMEVETGSERSRVWRLPDAELDLGAQLLIADGHHRYETAVAYRDEQPEARRTLAVLVSSRSPGLEIFPTHRVVQEVEVEPHGLMTSTWDTSALTLYRHGNFFRLETDDDLDTREIERYLPRGVDYTPRGDQAIGAVDAELAALAFLVRAPAVAQVFAYAERG